MNALMSVTRTLISGLQPGRRRSQKITDPQARRAWPEVTSLPMTPKSHEARMHLVAWMLRLTATDWENNDTTLHSALFHSALTDYMAEATHPVAVTAYSCSRSPRDRAYRAIQKAALNLAAASWGNGRETAGDSADLDYADDLLDDALRDYIDAARSE